MSSRKLHYSAGHSAQVSHDAISKEYPIVDHTYDAIVVGAGKICSTLPIVWSSCTVNVDFGIESDDSVQQHDNFCSRFFVWAFVFYTIFERIICAMETYGF